jgi:transcriptional regulator with XRE-family HTH domain
MTTLREKLAALPADRRARIEAEAAKLIAEELTLRELRRARALTQARMAKLLKVRQDTVSRLEQRTDMLLSTMQNYVRAAGGELTLVAEFPNRPPVRIKSLDEVGDAPKPKRKAKRA